MRPLRSPSPVLLEDLRVEVPHSCEPDFVVDYAETRFNQLAAGRFAAWDPRWERCGQQLRLEAKRGGTTFVATVKVEHGGLIVRLDGAIQLSRLKLTLAGGPRGVRRLISGRLSSVIREQLVSLGA